MYKFSCFVENVRQLPSKAAEDNPVPKSRKRIRVAILDDGIDWFYAHKIGCRGTSFYVDNTTSFSGQRPWYSSTTDHGTLMAALIRKVCPNVSLYVARLDQTASENGFQPTADSATKVRIL